MQPLSPSLARAVQARGSVPAQRAQGWQAAADEIALVVLGSSLIWTLAALVLMLLH